jgi:plasmid stabilization system protein ParE
MAHVVYSSNAVSDLGRLHQFLADKNPPAAARALRVIRDKLKLLARFPHLGPIDPEQPDYHELVIAFGAAGYVARYRIEGEMVIILAVRHSGKPAIPGSAETGCPATPSPDTRCRQCW